MQITKEKELIKGSYEHFCESLYQNELCFKKVLDISNCDQMSTIALKTKLRKRLMPILVKIECNPASLTLGDYYEVAEKCQELYNNLSNYLHFADITYVDFTKSQEREKFDRQKAFEILDQEAVKNFQERVLVSEFLLLNIIELAILMSDRIKY